MISFPPENTGSRKNWIAVFVILMNMESVPFFFHSRNWFCCSSFVVIISSGWKEVLFVHSYRCVPFRFWHFSSNDKVDK
jgi:hypothetical protein